VKINIVTVQSGWILQKIAQRIVDANKSECLFSLGTKSSNLVDANFYIDITNCYQRKSQVLDIGYFTHLHKNNLSSFQNHWGTLDFIVHQTNRYFKMFSKIYPVEKMKVIYPVGILPGFDLYKPVLGVFQRGGCEGKGENFLAALGECSIVRKYRFLFVGGGWEKIYRLFLDKGVDVEWIQSENYELYSSYYDRIDFLLIPSMWEGGPMCIVEALSKGIPIISSDVGWVNCDFRVEYSYTPGNVRELVGILNGIIAPLDRRRKQVENMSYAEYAAKLVSIVKSLKKK